MPALPEAPNVRPPAHRSGGGMRTVEPCDSNTSRNTPELVVVVSDDGGPTGLFRLGAAII